MSEDTYTEMTTGSWFGRIGNAITGVVLGLIFFVAAFPVLFWNEGRAVKQFKTLNEGAASVISLPEAHVMAEYDGELVHVAGQAITEDIVADPVFDVAVNAIRLERKVEMYQWVENKRRKTKKKLGGGKKTVTTYTYSKNWSSRLIDSSRFKKPSGHYNPSSMAYRSDGFIADEVSLGEFKLSRSLIGKINRTTPLPVADLANIEGITDASFHGSGIYIGENPSSPQIGDLRINYHIVAPTEVSVVSRQVGASFEPYLSNAGGSIDMLSLGLISADNMFQKAHQSNKMWTWIFRAGGFILMLIGVALILRPLAVAADIVPFLGSVAGFGTGILALLIAAPFTFLTVAVAWLRYRPVIAISFMVMAAIITGLVLILSRRVKKSATNNPAGVRQINRSACRESKSRKAETRPAGEIYDDGIEMAPPPVKVQAIRKNTEDMLKKGQNFFKTGQYDRAVMEFSRVIESGGNKKLALYNRGVALFKLNKKDAAMKDFKFAAKLGHEKARAILNQVKS